MAVATNLFPIPTVLETVVPRFFSESNMAGSLAVVYERAKVLQAKRCHDDAMKELDKFIELAEECEEEQESLNRLLARAWNDRGHLKYLQVDFYGAVDDFTQAIKLENDFAVPFYNRGQIHYRMGM